jgi:HTH-type transcriptional regulator/antitoxin HigA
VRTHAEEIMRTFFEPLGGPRYAVALYRRTQHTRSAREMDSFALAAWTARIAMLSRADPPTVDYEPGAVTREFMTELVRLSWSDRGPLLAIEFLRKHGVAVIVEPHLPRTHLDGAAILVETDRPVIGLTLRHDRIDNFWFCLMHELAHVALHLDKNKRDFFDDLDVEPTDDPLETEADTYAGEVLIPSDAWASSAASKLRSAAAAESLAKKLRIHPAIVAGRIRHEFGSYRVLNQLVGHREVRKLFTDVSWE